LPPGSLTGTKRNQEVIGREVPDCILEREQRVVSTNGPACFAADLFQMAEDFPKSLVCLLPGSIRS